MTRRVAILLLLLFLLPAFVYAATCTSICATGVVCDWEASGTWTGCSGGTPDTSGEDVVIQADDTISLSDDGLTIGVMTISGTLFFAERDKDPVAVKIFHKGILEVIP